MTSLFFLVFLFSSSLTLNVDANPNYVEALSKSLLFFQGQRSGPLPTDQQLSWRASSGLSDGSSANVDLTGGYYDAGDNIKFNFPMAFTTTMLSWSTLEYGAQMGPHLQNVSRVNIRWATDYLLKCATATPGKLYVGVGDPNADHKCWERPEDMDTPRTVYYVSSSNPGSDVAAETAAALAAASMVFREVDSEYSLLLLAAAKNVMQFAIQYRGNYSDSLSSSVCPFYCSYSGYKDELMWGAAWLLKATDDSNYKNFIESLGGGDHPDIFNWDSKYAGAYVLLSQRALVNKDINYELYKQEAESFICKILPNSPSTHYTPGGLMYKLPQSNLQHVTAVTFLLTTYAKYMKAIQSLGGGDQPDIFNWDNKYAGAYVLLSQRALVNNDNTFEQYKLEAESFICKILPNTPSSSTSYTPGGLMYNYKLPQSNLQHVTAITFLLTTYAKYMKATQHTFNCGNSVTIVPDTLISLSKQEVDYILGENPAKMSYMVGYGTSFPMRIHHRGSSIPSQPHFSCADGLQFLNTSNPNPNILTGAIVGGPNEKDAYADNREDFIQSEPTTYINAPFVGPLAYFASGGSA
ncbi:endoglucanase 9 isoform X1 [Brassica rapa]|uniref:endoglucanase 9 isoform X1 n=1 Tax=Brassica campestris TaxID=3711 RepID=UPI00142D97B2|nr:endoglucanase 9 isoform X1 [Brassica rapa]